MLALLATLLALGADVDSEPFRGPAKLAIVQGAIEIAGASQTPKAGDDLEAGATIKTPAAGRATCDFADGSELRISENTEVTVDGPRKVTLKHGKIFVKAAKSATPFEIGSEHVQSITEGGLVEVQVIPKVPDGDLAKTFVRVLEGKVKTTGKKFVANIFAGYYTTANGSQLNTPDPLRSGPLETAWIHPLLAERGRSDEETQSRAMELVQLLGRETSNDPGEIALRSLGDLGTAELARFIARAAGAPHPARRLAATRIIAETGTLKSAPALVSLLQYPEPEIRVQAAHGLARLAGGKDLGFNDAFWSGETRDAGQKAWEDWLKQNSK